MTANLITFFIKPKKTKEKKIFTHKTKYLHIKQKDFIDLCYEL